MSSGMDLRKRGKRKDPETIASKKQRGRLGDPLNAIDAGSPGEIRISSDTMIAISHLYNSSPSIQAARAILLGQLLGSGVVVRRQGRDVNLKPVFARHLEDVWVPFARQVIDHFLMFGFVLVSLEKESPPPFANFVKGKQLAATSSREIALVRAAIDSRRKKTEPRRMPPDPISANASGIEMKTRPGPASGAWPKLKTMGNIIMQASRAIPVSRPAIQIAWPKSGVPFFWYDP